MGYDADAITHKMTTHMGARKDVLDYTLPLASLFAGKKFETLTRKLFNDAEIVDTWRSFFCMSTDMTRATEVTHRKGPMWKYIRASCSLPIAFPPQIDGDNLLIDGCFMNNFPVNIMHDTDGCGTIIGVKVCLEVDMRGRNQYGNSLSGWEILNSKLNPFAGPVNAPGPLDIMYRLCELNSAERSQEQRMLTDLYIRPPIQRFSAQGMEKHEEIIEVGYRAAQSSINRWLSSED